MAASFPLTIITPKHTFFSGEVESLQIESTDGSLGILAGHEPMVASVADGMITIKLKDGTIREAASSSGFLTVTSAEADLLVQTAEWAENIDEARARDAMRLANEKLRQQKSMQEYHMARSMLARAMVRLRVTARGHRNNPNNQ